MKTHTTSQTLRSYRTVKVLVLVVASTLLLTACAGFAFSPTDAAVSTVRDNRSPDVTLVEDSIQVHQTVKTQDNRAVVVLSFHQIRAQSGEESCLYTWQVQKRSAFWMPKSGGGGCWSIDIPDDMVEDVQIGAGQSTSSEPGDIGFSEVYGLVRNPDIVKVSVTWNDDTVDEVNVINSTFVAYRFGLFEMQTVEGLNQQDEVIYTNSPQVAPGKQP